MSFFQPVQEKVIPVILKDVIHGTGEVNFIPRDICVSAATGSGKTLAFAIPIVQVIKLVLYKFKVFVKFPFVVVI